MSPDERSEVETAFGDALRISEQLFIERWFQLLREGGEFCCILPEAILDTSTNRLTRMFLIKHFQIIALVSLPYDAFKPFTSTKTCIVYARKRSHAALTAWDHAWADASRGSNDQQQLFQNTLATLGYDNEVIFMAEPLEIGYKRRKNLPDLIRPNHLYQEGAQAEVRADPSNPQTVLDFFRGGESANETSDRGFWIKLSDIA